MANKRIKIYANRKISIHDFNNAVDGCGGSWSTNIEMISYMRTLFFSEESLIDVDEKTLERFEQGSTYQPLNIYNPRLKCNFNYDPNWFRKYFSIKKKTKKEFEI